MFQASVPYQAELKIATHFFAVRPLSPKTRSVIYQFAQPLLEFRWEWDQKLRRNVRVAGKVWGGSLADYSEFRYPISLLPKLLAMFNNVGVPEELVRKDYFDGYEPAHAEIVLQEWFKLRDYQQEALNFTEAERQNKGYSVLIAMPTGTGKGAVLMAYAAFLKLRMAIVCSASYGDKWVEDIKKYIVVTDDQINKVSGRGGIRKIFDAGDSYDKNFTIFSTETLQRFFKEYEENPQLAADIYGGVPMDLWKSMKCGFLGGDEMHESINTIYWLNTFIHGPFHMGMSATMLHKDQFIETRQKEIYPVTKRFDQIKMAKYISVIYLGYYFKDFSKSRIRTAGQRGTYSQDEFEHSIVKSKISKENFADMVVSVVREYFVNKRQPGDKLRVYFSRIKMIDLVTSTLKLEFPDLDIRRYAEDDDYAHVIEAEIGVTNRGKAGTGVDIPGLTTVINFTNVESSQAVLQLLGRLREIPGRDVFFIQAYCKNVNKHLQYKEATHRLIQDRIKQSVHHDYPYPL